MGLGLRLISPPRSINRYEKTIYCISLLTGVDRYVFMVSE